MKSILKVSSLKVSRSSLVPELNLHLLTAKDPIWHQDWRQNEQEGFEPFWAIFWPGGQVLTRYIIDSKVAQGKRGEI